MDASHRHQRTQEIFLAARALDGEERTRYLSEACAGDATLRRDVEALLEQDARPIRFLDRAVEGEVGRGVLRECFDTLEEEHRDDADHDGPLADVRLPNTRVIGKFHIRRKIGEGGMGTVYEAEQEQPKRTVALKILRGSQLSPEAIRRFERECELLGRLQHPGIAQVFASGREETDQGPLPYLAMELVRGEPLLEYARRRQLAIPARMELLARVADAVQHAHQHGVIHRDLKPSNILVDETGSPKILDFGIARASDSDVQLTSLHTDVGQILGTLAYMSPEQASGDPAAIDTRSDVYSLGVLLYELLSNRLPYDVSRKLLHEAVRVICEEAPQRLSTVASRLGGDVETLVSKALEKEKERRYGSAREFAEDIRRHLRNEPILARPASGLYLLRKFVRRHRSLVICALLVFAALVAGLIFSVHYGLREAGARRIAEREAYRANLSAVAQAVREGNFVAARSLHERIPAERRGWEWHHLDRNWITELARVDLQDVFAAAFLPDGEVLVVASAGALLRWDPATGARNAVPSWSDGKRAVALSEDGRHFVAYDRETLFVGEPFAAEPRYKLSFPEGPPKFARRSASIAADGQHIAVTTTNEEIYLIELLSGARHQIDETPGEVREVEFSPSASRLATNREGRVRVWDKHRLAQLHATSNILAFAPDDSTLVIETNTAYGAGAALYFKDAESGRTIRRHGRNAYGAFHTRPCSDLRYSPDQRLLAVAFETHEAHIIEADAGLPWPLPDPLPVHVPSGVIGSFHHEGKGPLDVYFNRAGSELLSIRPQEGSIRIWHVGRDEAERLSEPEMGYVWAVAVHPDGSMIAATGEDGAARIWDATLQRQLVRIALPGTGKSLAYSPDGKHLACGAIHGLLVLDARSGETRFNLPDPCVNALAFTSDSQVLAAATADGKIRLWDVAMFEELAVLESKSQPLSVAFHPDGSSIAAGFLNGELKLWERSSGNLLARLLESDAGLTHYRGARSVAFAPDGRHLAVAWGNSSVTIHSIPSLERIQVLQEHRGEVFAVAYSPDGVRLASAGRDGLLRIWEATSGSLLFQREAHGSYIMALAIDADGRRVITGSGDKSVRIWDSAPIRESWARGRSHRRAEPAAQRLVAKLFAELATSADVLQRLANTKELDQPTRRMAQIEVLRRASPDGR